MRAEYEFAAYTKVREDWRMLRKDSASVSR